ncbi:hypothetical protein NDU88_003943 [Pleurodeles waltl]|uniref:Uncharacterized protein n=1 Tax=Pleurodeles waltl TaxID=8319 RepID=A0AAV7SHG6_PLEWA|nr:hypothetical protein NDU88_003943 [Pleurodeles waltl]
MSPAKRCQQHPVPPQKRPTVMTAALVTWIWMTNLAHQGSPDSNPGAVPYHHRASTLRKDQHSTHPAGPYLCPQDKSISSVSTTTGTQATPQTQDDQGPRVNGSGHTVQGTEAQDNREGGRTTVQQGEDRARERNLQEALTVILGEYQHSQHTLGQILDKLQENRRLQEGQYLGIREDLKDINTTLVSIARVLADMANSMREAVAHHRAPDTSQTAEHPSISAAASRQEARHRNNRPPAPLPPQKENHPANVPCNPGISQRLLPRAPPRK